MGSDFNLLVKCTIFGLNRGLRIYLDLYGTDYPKITSKYFSFPSTLQSIFKVFFVTKKNFQIMFLKKNNFGQKRKPK